VIPVSKLLQLSLNWLTVPSFTICQHLLREAEEAEAEEEEKIRLKQQDAARYVHL
jgi:hypothetical protein